MIWIVPTIALEMVGALHVVEVRWMVVDLQMVVDLAADCADWVC